MLDLYKILHTFSLLSIQTRLLSHLMVDGQEREWDFICNQFELIATNRLSSTLTIHFLKDRQAVTLDSRTLTACLTFQKCMSVD